MQTILITGGSSGIGLALAKQLARHPVHLLILARSEERLRLAKSEIARHADKRTVVSILSANVADVKDLSEKLQPYIDHLDIVIHCAGLGLAKSIENTNTEDYQRLMSVNFMGVVHVSRLILPAMKRRSAGRMIIVSSMAGLVGIFGYTAYSASKFAVEGFAQSLRNELSGTGVHLGVVYPPDVDTPMLAAENETKPEITKAISGSSPLTADSVATHIIKHIPRRTFRIIPGFWNRLNYFLIVNLPQLTFAFIDRIANKKRNG